MLSMVLRSPACNVKTLVLHDIAEVKNPCYEFDLLAALMSAPGRAFSRLDLLERVQGDAFDGYQRTIDVHIRNLRTKIESDPGKPRYVESVYGVGYRFAVDAGGGRAVC